MRPISHGFELGGRAPEAPYRLGVPLRRNRHILRFVADINTHRIGMHDFQSKVFALDLPHRLAPLLAVHLGPTARRGMVRCLLGFTQLLVFPVNLPHVEFNLARPDRRTLIKLPIGVRPFSFFRTTPATIYTIASTGAMLIFGQESSREMRS
jgi:hypothetical protein